MRKAAESSRKRKGITKGFIYYLLERPNSQKLRPATDLAAARGRAPRAPYTVRL